VSAPLSWVRVLADFETDLDALADRRSLPLVLALPVEEDNKVIRLNEDKPGEALMEGVERDIGSSEVVVSMEEYSSW